MIETLKGIDYKIFNFINQQMSYSWLDTLCIFSRDPKHLKIFYIIVAISIIIFFRKKGIIIALFAGMTMGLSDIISSHFF